MMTNSNSEKPKSWLEQLSLALLRAPQNLEHLLKILRDACSSNLLDSDTLAMVEGVIRYSKLRVRDIMLPRSQIISISSDSTYESILKIVEQHSHSRYPIYDNNIDSIIGILHAKDLLMQTNKATTFSINDVLRPATFVPESKHLNILLTEFKSAKNHMAIVVDEYGSVSGFVTIEDVIEQIVGDIEDEFDNNEDAYINKHKDGRFIIKAAIPIEEFNEYFNQTFNTEQYETLAGLLIKANENLPKVGEIITIADQTFKILNADNRRIKLVEFTVKDLI